MKELRRLSDSYATLRMRKMLDDEAVTTVCEKVLSEVPSS